MPKKPKTLEKLTPATHAYVGRAPCGCVQLLMVDMPDFRKDTAKSVAEAIREGLSIERITIEESRRLAKEITWDCQHKASAQQAPLFQGATA